jgi:hypothetical protein
MSKLEILQMEQTQQKIMRFLAPRKKLNKKNYAPKKLCEPKLLDFFLASQSSKNNTVLDPDKQQ